MGSDPRTLPGGSPFLLPGGSIGCLLIHGFTAMPEEMRLLGDHLAGLGHTVLGIRLSGHGTHPRDLARTRWTDWLVSVEDGLALLDGMTERIVLIGQSLGGVVALTAAARYRAVSGVVAISTPYGFPRHRWRSWLTSLVPRLVRKPVPAHPDLGLRREADYPAYAAVPNRIHREVERLGAAMHDALRTIECPVLVIQSRADPWVPVEHAHRIHQALRPATARILEVEGLGHSIALYPRREEAFAAIRAFVEEISPSESGPPER